MYPTALDVISFSSPSIRMSHCDCVLTDRTILRSCKLKKGVSDKPLLIVICFECFHTNVCYTFESACLDQILKKDNVSGFFLPI